MEEEKRKNSTLKHSRSFKYHNRTIPRHTTSNISAGSPSSNNPVILSPLDLVNSSSGSGGEGPASPTASQDCKTSDRLDSAYGTDSNRTASR